MGTPPESAEQLFEPGKTEQVLWDTETVLLSGAMGNQWVLPRAATGQEWLVAFWAWACCPESSSTWPVSLPVLHFPRKSIGVKNWREFVLGSLPWGLELASRFVSQSKGYNPNGVYIQIPQPA